MTDNKNDKRGGRAPRGRSDGRPSPGFPDRGGTRPPRRRREDEASGAPADLPAEEPAQEAAEERIAKAIARAGIASRRDAEQMIAEGRVTLNGEVLTSPAVNVGPGDRITVDGEPLPAKERTRLWLYHKPRGLVTTFRDPEGRPTVFQDLPEDLPRVVAVGRLDIATEGLLLLTNDGGLARVIAHPTTGWLRRYKVRAHGEITQGDLDRLSDGIVIDGIEYGPVEATLDREQGDNVWLTMGLREGKNREIKRILEHLGLRVNRLIRLSFGPFQLGDLEPGMVEEVRTRVLKDQLGEKLAAEAGVDFEAPVREPIAPFGSPKRDTRGAGERMPRRPAGPPPRPDRDHRRPFRDRRDERPAGGRPTGRPGAGRPWREAGAERLRAADRVAREAAPHRAERHGTVWRDAEAGPAHRGTKQPRRGADPKAARAASAARERERVGAIEAGAGRKVVVERLKSEPRPEAQERAPRRPRGAGGRTGERPAYRPEGKGPGRYGGKRGAPGGDEPPRRPREGGSLRGRGADERPRRGESGPGGRAGGGRGAGYRPKGPPKGRRP